MLRNDLKPLLGDNWKERFKHRDLWDPEGYGVASFDLGEEREKVLAINFATEDIMEYFYEDKPDDEWISLNRYTLINHSLTSNYKYKQSTGEITNGVRTRKLSPTVSERNEYPRGSIRIDNKTVQFKIHKLLATLYVPNPDPSTNIMVNHRNLNKGDFRLDNLEWCTPSENNLGKNCIEGQPRVYLKGTNDAGDVIIGPRRNFADCGAIESAIKDKRKYLGYFWERIDANVQDYLSRHPIDPNGWYDDNGLHNFGKHKVRANSCGVLEVDGKLTVGCFNRQTYLVRINKKSSLIHRLIFEIISGELLGKNDVIDHIVPVDSRDVNNEYLNLRKTDMKGNANNPLTKQKVGKDVFVADLLGNSVCMLKNGVITGEILGSSYKTISAACNSILIFQDKYIISHSSEGILKKIQYIFYKLSIDTNTLNHKIEGGNAKLCKLSWCDESDLEKYLNTGMPAPDGFYYQQGDPKNLIYDPNNLDLTKRRQRIFWRDRDKNN